MESLLVFVVIIAISAVSNWLKQKQEAQQQGEMPPAPGEEGGGETPRKRKAWDWETELRRLLEGDSAKATEAPEPPPLPPRRDVRPPESTPTPPRSPVVEMDPSRSLRRVTEEAKERIQERMAGLKTSEDTFLRARKLDQTVASRLAQLTEASRNQEGYAYGERRAIRRPGSLEAQRVRAALGNPRTAREAIIAAEILGEPRGLRA